MNKAIKRILVVFSLILSLVVGLFFVFGPGWNYIYSPALLPIKISDSVSDYISQKEALFKDIKEGNQSHLIIQPNGEVTEYAFVYLHGFSASPREISPVVENLATEFSYNAYLPRLSAHGLKEGLMLDLTADNFFQDAEEAYEVGKKIGKKVIVIGTSTGATLTLWLASRHPDIAGIVLLSPNLGIKDPRGFLAAGPVGYWIARMVVGPYYEWKPHYPNQEKFSTIKYSVNAVRVMTDVVNVANALPFEQIKMPALVMWTEKDDVINLKHALAALKRLPRSEFIESPSADHVLAGDINSPATTPFTIESISSFVKKSLQTN